MWQGWSEMSFSDIPAFLVNLQKAHERRQQRKLLSIDVQEVSGVDHPAHLHEGWMIRKEAGAPHAHATDRHYLSDFETHTADALHGAADLKPGDSKKLTEEATLNRENCGCLSLTTAGTVAKAEREVHENRFEKSARYTPEEEAFLLGKDDTK